MTPVTRVEGEPPAGATVVVDSARALMPTEVKLPRLGQGMESGVIVRWLKAEGDAISKGDPLYELDTDKVTQEVESDVDRDAGQDRRRGGRGGGRSHRRRDRRDGGGRFA